jgi:hypothetical protein
MKILLSLVLLLAVAAPVYASDDRPPQIQAPVSADEIQAP